MIKYFCNNCEREIKSKTILHPLLGYEIEIYETGSIKSSELPSLREEHLGFGVDDCLCPQCADLISKSVDNAILKVKLNALKFNEGAS